MSVEPEVEALGAVDLGAALADALTDAASDLNLELWFTPGEIPDEAGEVTMSALLSLTTGSIALIEDTQGGIWLTCWTSGQESGLIRRVAADNDLDELIEFCSDLL